MMEEGSILPFRLTRWGNPTGLAKLEYTERTIQDRLSSVEAEIPKWSATYQHSLAIRDRFLSSFLRDHYPAQYTW